MSLLPRLQLPVGRHASTLGITALVTIVTGWLLFAWALADMDTPRPNGAPPNRSEAELGVVFIGFVATVLAGLGAMLAARGLHHDRRDRCALAALALGALTIAAAFVGWEKWLGV